MTLTDDHLIPRREFLRFGSAASLALAPEFRLPLTHGGRRAEYTNLILIQNTGGMSHLDLWDPKPEAPGDIRGEFSAIATNVPGIFLSELLPETARIADKLAIVRSMTHSEIDHPGAVRETIRHLPVPIPDVGATRPEQDAGGLQPGLTRACRMIEEGCHFVSIENGHWDTHIRNAWCLSNILAPAFDRAFAGLIENLADRGLLDSTLVVVATEFGRSPRINRRAGRDHWPHAFSIVLAGGGIEGGQVVGRTDRHGAAVVDRL